MNVDTLRRALVVDDEPIIRQATMRALSRAGFCCESASNGTAASEMVAQARFDVVVTDLRMPEANGHQLAVDLLALPNRPAIVVLTGIMEPKLVNDLKLRGVDEIFFKPVSFDVFAKQVFDIVHCRSPVGACGTSDANEERQPAASRTADGETRGSSGPPVALQLAKAAALLHHPPRDFDGFSRGSANAVRANDLGHAIELDPAIAPEVLAFANRLLYGSNRAIAELERSVAALQQKKAVRAIVFFMGGVFLGGLLGWLVSFLAMKW